MEPLSGIAVDVPENVQRGEAARLFPVLSERSQEGRAASVFLCTLSIIDTLADALLRRLGRPIGKRTKINAFTEVVLKSDPKFRPDGLIVVDTGRDTWSALVECKIGKAKIDPEQLESYIKKARENDIDCVITISNELVADPRRPPTTVDGRLTRSVGHFHYSWLAIRSEAEIAYTQGLVDDPEKNFILAELIRFLSHPSTGVEGFTQMPPTWPDIVSEIGADRAPKKTDPRVADIISGWLQEEKELTLILSRLVSRRCNSRSEKRLRREGYDPVDEATRELIEAHQLTTEFVVPDAASEISLCCDLKSRSTRISMTLRAPEDRKRPEARLNWLLGQLKTVDPKNVEIVAHWPGRTKPTFWPLSALKTNPRQISEQTSGMTPYAFEVVQTCHSPSSFAARRRFISELESSVQQFYANVGRHLTAWSPKAPPPAEKTAADQIEEDSVIDPERPSSLEQSLAHAPLSLSKPDDVSAEDNRASPESDSPTKPPDQ